LEARVHGYWHRRTATLTGAYRAVERMARRRMSRDGPAENVVVATGHATRNEIGWCRIMMRTERGNG